MHINQYFEIYYYCSECLYNKALQVAIEYNLPMGENISKQFNRGIITPIEVCNSLINMVKPIVEMKSVDYNAWLSRR